MLLTDQYMHNKSITVSVLGKPNAGKSSLINTLLGFDLAAVTHKPQTTRNRFSCVFTIDHTEIILMDTPGLHTSKQELNKRMNHEAGLAGRGSDVNLLVVPLDNDIFSEVRDVIGRFDGGLKKTWLVFNKSDLIEMSEAAEAKIEAAFTMLQQEFPCLEKFFILSSKTEDNVHLLTGALCDEAEPGPHLYNKGRISNRPQKFFIAEYIREQAFLLTKEELPYELAVVVDDVSVAEDRRGSKAKYEVSATILVNRPSQRAIVVGSKGSVIKQIGVNSRAKIEDLMGDKVFLNLHVKVSPKWFKNNYVLEQLGLPRAPDSTRVWRQS